MQVQVQVQVQVTVQTRVTIRRRPQFLAAGLDAASELLVLKVRVRLKGDAMHHCRSHESESRILRMDLMHARVGTSSAAGQFKDSLRAMVFGSAISLGGAHLLRYVGKKRRVLVSSKAEQMYRPVASRR